MKTAYNLTTQAAVRSAFWESFPRFKRRMIPAGRSPRTGRLLYRVATQNEYPATVRCAFVEYVDSLSRDGVISASLADSVTL